MIATLFSNKTFNSIVVREIFKTNLACLYNNICSEQKTTMTINWTLFSYCCKDTLPDIQHQPQHNQPYKSWSRSAHLPHKLVGRSLYRHNHCYMDTVPDTQHWLQHRRTDRSWSRSGCWSHKLGQTLPDICRRRLWWWWCLDNFPLYEHL